MKVKVIKKKYVKSESEEEEESHYEYVMETTGSEDEGHSGIIKMTVKSTGELFELNDVLQILVNETQTKLGETKK